MSRCAIAGTLKITTKALVDLVIASSKASKQMAQFIDAVLCVPVSLRRISLEIVLMRRWHIPNDAAFWLAQHWPKRWLPALWEDDKEDIAG